MSCVKGALSLCLCGPGLYPLQEKYKEEQEIKQEKNKNKIKITINKRASRTLTSHSWQLQACVFPGPVSLQPSPPTHSHYFLILCTDLLQKVGVEEERVRGERRESDQNTLDMCVKLPTTAVPMELVFSCPSTLSKLLPAQFYDFDCKERKVSAYAFEKSFQLIFFF